ncbi:MAG: phage terminase small subunit P27 family [Elusimicrobiales bacterium]|nr:phage terminase small subunit P27 family [Elusimicrobiales bacterium]
MLAPKYDLLDVNTPPPDILTGEVEKAKWKQLCETLAQNGVLKVTDADVLTQYCVGYGVFHTAKLEVDGLSSLVTTTHNGSEQPAAEITTLRKSSELLLRLGAELGLSPSARNKITAVNQNDELAEALKFIRHGKKMG